jgi:hypothetical protein
MIKEKIKSIIKAAKAFDDYITNCDSYNACDVDAKIARRNYKLHQEDLKQRQQNCIEKWCEKINEVSRNGAQCFDTNCFIVDSDDKNKICWIVDDGGCVAAFPSNATLEYFKQYFEDKGFDVVIVEWPYNHSSLRISWVD